MLSYNEIIKANKTFSDNHLVIKNFGNGERWQINDHDQVPTFKYPLMWMEDLPNSTSEKEWVYNFRVWFVTRVKTPINKDNQLMYSEYAKAKSDMIQCAQDLMAYWVQDILYPSLEIEKSTNLETFIDTQLDKITGCSIDISFRVNFNYNNCLIPSSDNI